MDIRGITSPFSLPITPEAATPEQDSPAAVTSRLRAIDARHSLYEQFSTHCPPASRADVLFCRYPAVWNRLTALVEGPMGAWISWITERVTTSDRYLAGSAARYVGGTELLHQLFQQPSERLEREYSAAIRLLIDGTAFKYNDFDLHFVLPKKDYSFEELEFITNTVITQLPQGTDLIGPPVISHALTHVRIKLHDTVSKIKIDLIFEVAGQQRSAFGADDLRLRLLHLRGIPCFSSTDFSAYFVGQTFRLLQHTGPIDESLHRRLLLLRTLGYWADPKLIADCRLSAQNSSEFWRSRVLGFTIAAHLPASGPASWILRLAHQQQWRGAAEERLPDGHILTETLNSTVGKPEMIDKAHALLTLIGFIALLENHSGEMSATVRCGELQLQFPGEYSLWLPLDPRPAIAILSTLSANEWTELRRVVTCMPKWIPVAQVSREHIGDVNSVINPFGPLTLYRCLEDTPCACLGLRLQAALMNYGAPAVPRSAEFWKQAVHCDNLAFLRIESLLATKRKILSSEHIQWCLEVLIAQPDRALCLRLADRLILQYDTRAIDLLKLCEEHPDLDWDPVARLISSKKTLREVHQGIRCARLQLAGIGAVERHELEALLSLIEERAALLNLARQLLTQGSDDLFRIGLDVVLRIRCLPEVTDLLTERHALLPVPLLLDFVLDRKLPLTEQVLDRLLSAQLELKTYVQLMQRYKGPDPERRWQQVATRLTFAAGTIGADWPKIPGVQPRDVVLWTGVAQAIEGGQIQKAKDAMDTLLNRLQIEPPGGRVALMTWLLHLGTGSHFCEVLGFRSDPCSLLDRDSDGVCETLRMLPGPVKLGSQVFASRVIEHLIVRQQPVWPLYTKLGCRPISESLRLKWLQQEACTSTVCRMLPQFRKDHPFLETLGDRLLKMEILEELARRRETADWAFAILLKSPATDWPVHRLRAVVSSLLNFDYSEQRVRLLAVYGARLPAYATLWESVVRTNPVDCLPFTAVWIEQGISPVALKALHVGARPMHASIADLLRHCEEQESWDILLELWNGIPQIRSGRHCEMGKRLCMKVDDLALMEWVLKKYPNEEALLLRAARLPITRQFATDILLQALKTTHNSSTLSSVGNGIIAHLAPSDLSEGRVDRLLDTYPDFSSATRLAELCLQTDHTPQQMGVACRVILYIWQEHKVWTDTVWRVIFAYFTHPNRTQNQQAAISDCLQEFLREQCAFDVLDKDDYWSLLRTYAVSAHTLQQCKHACELVRRAVEALPPGRRPLSLQQLGNLLIRNPSNYAHEDQLILRMEEQQWFDAERAALLRMCVKFLRFYGVEATETYAQQAEQLCHLLVELQPTFRRHADDLWPTESPGSANDCRLLSICLQPILEAARILALTRTDSASETFIKRMVEAVHSVVRRPAMKHFHMGAFIAEAYLGNVVRQKHIIPEWWLNRIADLVEEAPIGVVDRSADAVVLLSKCALRLGPANALSKAKSNPFMQRVCSYATRTLESLPVEFHKTRSDLIRSIFVCGGWITEQVMTAEPGRCVQEFSDALWNVQRMAALDGDTHYLWYRELAQNMLLTASTAGFRCESTTVVDIWFGLITLITTSCPQNLREQEINRFTDLLTDDQIRNWFYNVLPPTSIPKKTGTKKCKKVLKDDTLRREILMTFVASLKREGWAPQGVLIATMRQYDKTYGAKK